MRITFVSQEAIAGKPRKIAWFVRSPNGLYYDVGGLLWGSHTSYHVDGNVFRTSPATGGRPRFQGRQMPLEAFTGWHQLGIAMIDKTLLGKNRGLKARDRRRGNVVVAVPILALEAETPNILIELVHDSRRSFEDTAQFQVPPGASTYEARLGDLGILLTVIGTDAHLLIKPIVGCLRVSHFNDRFTANAKGVTYTFEAYGSQAWRNAG